MHICVKRDAERRYIHEINIYYINFMFHRKSKRRGELPVNKDTKVTYF